MKQITRIFKSWSSLMLNLWKKKFIIGSFKVFYNNIFSLKFNKRIRNNLCCLPIINNTRLSTFKKNNPP